MKTKKASIKGPGRNAHVADTKLGMGDFYGSGVRNKVGRIRDSYVTNPSKPKSLKKPPKSLA